DPDPITQTYEEETPTLEAFNRVEDIYFKECSVGRDLERSHKNRSLMSK
ncbi:10368_t:CDS:1, partial [Funneliformis geosporum]